VTLVRFLLVRLITGVLGLLVFASAIWLLSTWLIPGDFTSNFIGVNSEERDAIRAALGLDRPVLERYLEFVGGLLRLDLGTTFGGAFSGTSTVIESGEPVTDLVLGVLPWTMTLFALSIGLGFLIGLPLGRRVGWENRPVSPTLMAAATATSIFPPWLALVIANVGLTIIGVTGYVRLRNLDDVMWDTPPSPVNVLWWVIAGLLAAGITMVWLARTVRLGRHRWLRWLGPPLLLGIVITAWWQFGLLPRIIDLLGILSMPLFALTLTTTGEVILVVSAAMAGTADAPYSHAARAKGLSPGMIRRRHAGRATLLPAISRMAASLPYTLGGLVILERAFASVGSGSVMIPGLSSTIFLSGQTRNTPLAVGGVIAIGVIALFVRLIVDVVHLALDPRVTAEASGG
jgi:ABC-type dipeptide/oligopeptide/nickel transport system permease component